MRETVTRVLMVLIGVVLGASSSASAQDDRALDALGAVITWRVNWVQDTTSFDACSLFDAAGRPGTSLAGLETRLERFVTGSATQCGTRSGEVRPTPGPNLNVVVVDSARLGEDLGHVAATIYHGDAVHHEEYTLVRRLRWVVTEMRMWGAETESHERP